MAVTFHTLGLLACFLGVVSGMMSARLFRRWKPALVVLVVTCGVSAVSIVGQAISPHGPYGAAQADQQRQPEKPRIDVDKLWIETYARLKNGQR